MNIVKQFILLLLLPSFLALGKSGVDLFGVHNPVILNQAIEKNMLLADSDANALKVIGMAWHQFALDKKNKASENAVDFLTRYYDSFPQDMEALAWLGSSYTMLARDSSVIYKKITFTNKGLAFLDKAVNGATDNYEIRLLRAAVSYSVPDMFDRKKVSYNDYLYIVSNFSLPSEQKSEIYFKLGELAEDTGNKSKVDEFYKQSIAADGNSEWAIKAKRGLKWSK